MLSALEWYLGVSLRVFEKRGAEELAPQPSGVETTANYHYLGRRDPVEFCRDLRSRVEEGAIVFVGDSQGAAARDHGPGYPLLVARRLADGGHSTPVISLHAGGANAYEQGMLLLTLLDAGIEPRIVVWSHSIFSQRKNEIRNEYAKAWHGLGGKAARIAPDVIVPALPESMDPEVDRLRRVVASVSGAWEGLITRAATVRFMRRPLWDKGEIVRRSPLCRLLPAGVQPGTARQFDPPASILREAARFVGEVSVMLGARGAVVMHFVAPINRAVSPRPFSARAEDASYPALERAAQASGSRFLNLLDAMPPERFGRYEDGSPDAFHLDESAHAKLADLILSQLPEMPR